MPGKKWPSDAQLRKLYKKHNGVIAHVARELGRPPRSVYPKFERLGLRAKTTHHRDRPSDEELTRLYHEYAGNIKLIYEYLEEYPEGTVRSWYRIMGLRGKGVPGTKSGGRFQPKYPPEITETLSDGLCVVFSDAHWWPEEPLTEANKALLKVLRRSKPDILVANGDLIDGVRISRHSPLGWDDLPMLSDELHEVQTRMAEIAKAAGAKCRRYYVLGNHDTRFEKYLIGNAKELEGIEGTMLEHHFPGWTIGWSLRVNGNTVIKHNWKSGVYAPRNNAMQSGLNLITGHLHSQKVFPHTDYTGTRYGVDAGTLADPQGPQFLYTQNNPLDWRSGFVVARFRGGKLLPPECVTTLDNGEVWWQKNEQVI